MPLNTRSSGQFPLAHSVKVRVLFARRPKVNMITVCLVERRHPKNPSMIRVGAAQVGCNPWGILMAKMPVGHVYLSNGGSALVKWHLVMGISSKQEKH